MLWKEVLCGVWGVSLHAGSSKTEAAHCAGIARLEKLRTGWSVLIASLDTSAPRGLPIAQSALLDLFSPRCAAAERWSFVIVSYMRGFV